MEKKTKIKFAIVSVLIIIGILLSTLSFDLIGSDKTFNGFIGAIETSTELDEYYSATFNIAEGATENQINKAVNKFYDIIDDYVESYSDFNISRQTAKDGTEQIVLTCSKNAFSGFYGGSSFIEALGTPKKLGVKTSDSADAENLFDNSNIKSIIISPVDNYYAVYLSLDNEGSQKIIRYSDTDLYTFINGEKATGKASGNYFYVYETSYSSQATAYYAGISLLTGSLPVEISIPDSDGDGTYDNDYIVKLSPTAGSSVKYVMLYTVIGIMVFAIAYFVLRYKRLGIVASLSFVISVVLLTFLLQAIPLVSLTIGGYYGILINILLSLVSISYLINKIENEYKMGKDIKPAIKMGYQKAITTLADVHVIGVIASLVMVILGQTVTKNIAIILIAGLAVSALVSMGINYIMILWLRDLTVDNKHYNFTREVK